MKYVKNIGYDISTDFSDVQVAKQKLDITALKIAA